MENYKSNSFKSKENEAEKRKKVEKVVSGKVKIKKPNELTKIRDMFISPDARNVGAYSLMDVLVPALKDAVATIVSDGINMILFGSTKGSGKKRSVSDRVSYNKYYDDDRSRYSSTTRTADRYNFDNITFESRGDAEAVLDSMDEMLESYDRVSVADFYELCELSCEYTDNKYGWYSLKSADVLRTRDGYVIKLPRVKPLER